jgi:hypothetical protein
VTLTTGSRSFLRICDTKADERETYRDGSNQNGLASQVHNLMVVNYCAWSSLLHHL